MAQELKETAPLTAEQLKLVRDNLGLVRVHLRRNVCKPYIRRRDREWDDLFQEGCLGLIQAAVAFDPARGIPFPAFALPRIHCAVSRALQIRFSILHTPYTRRSRRHAIDEEETIGVRPPKVRAMPARPDCSRLRAVGRHRIDEQPGESIDRDRGRETVGERVRGKYERAVRAAAQAVSKSRSTRGDRDRLVAELVDERLMIPEEGERRALRQIARDTGSSFARVSQTDNLLITSIREQLESDPEFRELYRKLRTRPDARDITVDARVEEKLMEVAVSDIAAVYRTGSAQVRAAILYQLVSIDEEEVARLTRERFAGMTASERETFVKSMKIDSLQVT